MTEIRLWQSLTPVGIFRTLKHKFFRVVRITSTNDGVKPFIKQVSLLTSCDKLKKITHHLMWYIFSCPAYQNSDHLKQID